MSARNCPLVHVSVVISRDDSILAVQEAKADCRGQWNLPGGHLERGESILAGAVREVLEETHLHVRPEALVGIYHGPNSIRFVIAATIEVDRCEADTPRAGDEILAFEWITPVAMLARPDAQLVAAPMLRRILTDAQTNHRHPLDIFR